MSVSRRDFIRASAATAAGLAITDPARAEPPVDVNCIFLILVGGPSQIDTWDPKPAAPADVRGPFQPIRTTVTGLYLSELFPRMAASASDFAVVRSMHHTAAPIHETGHQLMQTGRLADAGHEHPHFGALVSAAHGSRCGVPANILLPGSIGFTGVNIDHGQTAGCLGSQHAPAFLPMDVENDPARARFGRTPFGDDCLRAARLIEQGSRFVTVNMFATVYDAVTWDCHAAGGSLATSLADYRSVSPIFDTAYAALLADLKQRGLLSSTLVVATGEFGRTPYVNAHGGRDHWAGVWSMLLAGGGIEGGQVIGASDRLGAEPKDTPVGPEWLAETIHHKLGLARRMA